MIHEQITPYKQIGNDGMSTMFDDSCNDTSLRWTDAGLNFFGVGDSGEGLLGETPHSSRSTLESIGLDFEEDEEIDDQDKSDSSWGTKEIRGIISKSSNSKVKRSHSPPRKVRFSHSDDVKKLPAATPEEFANLYYTANELKAMKDDFITHEGVQSICPCIRVEVMTDQQALAQY
mmetsp:Transcript_23467/g.36077  ORF Transcript_23467/g.36077 Transcript_23467/m.36077 type:complete len:175 (-) Transcript_23467:47-571(-)|eukprot:CAMPEP_0118678826 /NCGR_PEP_ID=MMETSP0800-20121206/3438_1 /TAXON_ID=210618 ORGANISM="Striatella unipunctata, Strain CCMP2910" /NCGR_SAMPLE_ID=MMETSP0800 /ASSEMBLY_ACC=CAM_ASM_000638 /LENGTH=174 /DNA_ID=CAMNT_0006574733 /DNA_START=129 /DNA_END=653 /DNA_ORIENTATION=+